MRSPRSKPARGFIPASRRSLVARGSWSSTGTSGVVIDQFMTQDPYRSANRVFVILDNGSRAPGEAIDPAPPGPLLQPGARAHARACQLGQSSRDLLLRGAAHGADPEQLRRPSTRLSGRCWRSAAATRRSPARLNGRIPVDVATPRWIRRTKRTTLHGMARSIDVRLNDASAAALDIIRATEMTESDVVRTALQEAAARRRVRSAIQDEVAQLARDPADRAEMQSIREQMAALAPAETD